LRKWPSINALLRQIDKHKNAIATHRDALREIYADLEAIVESSDEGLRLLEAAVEELSSYL